jgi:hypothetical protein
LDEESGGQAIDILNDTEYLQELVEKISWQNTTYCTDDSASIKVVA